MPNVVVYSSPGCGPCHAAMDFLKKLGVPYVEKNVIDETAQQELVELGSMSTPTILVDGKVLVGFNPKALLAALGR